MKSLCRFALVALIMTGLSACSQKPANLSVIPYPETVEILSGTFNAFGAKVVSEGLSEDERALIECFGSEITAASGGVQRSSNIVFHRNDSLASEEYEIKVGRSRIEVLSSSYNGTLYAIATLKQLMPVGIYTGTCDPQADWNIPCAAIKDKPRFGYRGVLLDCSRHFFSIDEVKKILDVMAVYKLNRFHWHLTDDHGWRMGSGSILFLLRSEDGETAR